ncbi:MAG: hypothetical protein HRU28_00145 [Rhizobiales bacterium]|nr:hypothetical protein [Hyphomicrobiales bacterium]
MTKNNEKMPERDTNVKRRWQLDCSGVLIATKDRRLRLFVIFNEDDNEALPLFSRLDVEIDVAGLGMIGEGINCWGYFPDEIMMDSGLQFGTKMFRNHLATLGIESSHHNYYRHNLTGKVERIMCDLYRSFMRDLNGKFHADYLKLSVSEVELNKYCADWFKSKGSAHVLNKELGGKNV